MKNALISDRESIDLAIAYLEDGAPFSALGALRKATSIKCIAIEVIDREQRWALAEAYFGFISAFGHLWSGGEFLPFRQAIEPIIVANEAEEEISRRVEGSKLIRVVRGIPAGKGQELLDLFKKSALALGWSDSRPGSVVWTDLVSALRELVDLDGGAYHGIMKDRQQGRISEEALEEKAKKYRRGNGLPEHVLDERAKKYRRYAHEEAT